MKIDRCVCYDVPFSVLKKQADDHGAASIGELQDVCDFGLRCQLCHPYVRRMLRTGTIEFDHVIQESDEPPRTPTRSPE